MSWLWKSNDKGITEEEPVQASNECRIQVEDCENDKEKHELIGDVDNVSNDVLDKSERDDDEDTDLDDNDGNSDDDDADADDDDDDDDDDDESNASSIENSFYESITDDDDISVDFLSSDDEGDTVHVSLVSAKKDVSNNNPGQHIDNNDERNQQQIENDSEDENDDNNNKDKDKDNDDGASSFWEKQSLLVLAAEHDRVDILKTLLNDENQDRDKLMNSGIPLIHIAIAYGSSNIAQSLLRMGADPSITPDINKVLKVRKSQPKDSKVDIPNIRRFDSVTAWELAFGNDLYDKQSMSTSTTKSKWSVFGESAAASSISVDKTSKRVVKPVDMAPSKREGIRHAFTAEALRSIGSDEVKRLKQLVDSGMPANIELGGKDLYGWAIEMGSPECEEILRPTKAAKYEINDDIDSQSIKLNDNNKNGSVTKYEKKGENDCAEDNERSSSFIVHRPPNETIPQLKNRLDELESLANSLSVCLDNLAEEVSVCHGLLLFEGGVQTLALHVKSLRISKQQKSYELQNAQAELHDTEMELFDLMQSTGGICKENPSIAELNFPMIRDDGRDNDPLKDKETETNRLKMKAQIAASENKIRKLRASITDLSEENTRDFRALVARGLDGGINLVRGIREELRDIEYNLSEVRSMKISYRAKINMIRTQVTEKIVTNNERGTDYSESVEKPSMNEDNNEPVLQVEQHSLRSKSSQQNERQSQNNDQIIKLDNLIDIPSQVLTQQQNNVSHCRPISEGTQLPSKKIATGDSRAISIIQPVNNKFFKVDLWEVLLRIIGFERAANRRSVQKMNDNSNPNVMII